MINLLHTLLIYDDDVSLRTSKFSDQCASYIVYDDDDDVSLRTSKFSDQCASYIIYDDDDDDHVV